jgi:transposase
MMEAARTIKRHWAGVLLWFKSRITNGVLEGINSLMQAAKGKGRGYRATENLITMVYPLAGKRDLRLTHTKRRRGCIKIFFIFGSICQGFLNITKIS